LFEKKLEPGMVDSAFDISTWEAETEEALCSVVCEAGSRTARAIQRNQPCLGKKKKKYKPGNLSSIPGICIMVKGET
jgi:hypothetical protein